MKKRGFSETLETLYNLERMEISQKKFFKILENGQSYYNAYLRVKPLLLGQDLINFKLNPEKKKMIYLTEKGIKFFEYITHADNLLEIECNCEENIE